jgi:uncharacterized membrane protein YeaQ/YmgE (transglycosylase-associated protein family)
MRDETGTHIAPSIFEFRRDRWIATCLNEELLRNWWRVLTPKYLSNNMELLISLICGAVGGNVGGLIFKKLSLGTLWNSVVGILGGGLGAQLLGMVGLGGSGILGQIGSGGVGGVVLMLIVAAIRKAIGK